MNHVGRCPGVFWPREGERGRGGEGERGRGGGGGEGGGRAPCTHPARRRVHLSDFHQVLAAHRTMFQASVGSDNGPEGLIACAFGRPHASLKYEPRTSATSSATEAPFAHSTEGAAHSRTGGRLGQTRQERQFSLAPRSQPLSRLWKGPRRCEGNGSTADGDNGHLRCHEDR